MSKIEKYANVVNYQENPNTTGKYRWNWHNTAYAVGSDNKQWAYSTYSVKSNKKGQQGIPEVLTAHDFKLNIPTNAYIDKVTFIAEWKVSKGLRVKAPVGAFMMYGGNGKVSDAKTGKTGWHNGVYYHYPPKVISTKATQVEYSISGTEWNKRKYPTKALNNVVMGIDFQFQEATKLKDNNTIHLNWVKIVVEYTLPKTTITYVPSSTSGSNPYSVTANKEFDLKVNFKQNKVNGGSQTFDVKVPWGTEIVSHSATDGSFNSSTNKYTINCSANSSHTLTLRLKPNGVGLKELVTSNSNVSSSFYYYPVLFDDSDYFTANITSTEARKGTATCFTFNIESESSNATQTFDLSLKKGNTYDDCEYISCTLDNEVSSDGVSIDSCTKTNTGRYRVTCTVPTNQMNTIKFDFCCYPMSTGNMTMSITDNAMNESYDYDFNCLNSYVYHLSNNIGSVTDTEYNVQASSDVIIFNTHHIPTEVESGAIFLNCSFEDGDALMIMKDNNLTAHYYEPIDYIGCVPLEHSHFDPKSTYKDTLLDSRYKNKRYMGKKLASDEDITLNVRLHPQQVTTIQGLIDMDKPIPINANHRCFEGDSLNHRGWCEIYGIKTEQTGNNPHWYKCEIDVKYITHNLNTRFNIHRGVKSYPIDMPTLLVPVLDYNDSLTELFEVNTDGTYTYQEDYDTIDDETEEEIRVEYDDNQRNKFEIDSGQSIQILSKSSLASNTNITVDWLSSKVTELKENLISRIFRIRDAKSSNVYFEYEYSDIHFVDDFIEANVIGRQLNQGSYEPLVIDKIIDLRVDDDSEIDEDTEDTSSVISDDMDNYYGSTLHFNLNNKKLTVIDEGFNGNEVNVVLDKELEGDEYVFEVEIINHNEDIETDPIVNYINVSVGETLLDTSRFSDKYDKMVVSPFPVADKKLLFIREAEEGVIYYFEDEEEDLKGFSYIVDPYYQYKNGVDLISDTGISIFNLNYGYNIVYMQNGLVRIGFNRLTGEIYLAKWDNDSESYIMTDKFHLTNEKDVGINYISDDKIVLQCGDSKFTMWRGHPYVMINHNGEDIIMDSKYRMVWGEEVNGEEVEFPSFFDLSNNKNLLPKNIGGNVIDISNLETDSTEDVSHATITLAQVDTPLYTNTDTTFSLSGSVGLVDESIPLSVNTYDGIFGSYTIDTIVDNTVINPSYFVISSVNPIKTGDTISINAHIVDYDGNGISNKLVQFLCGDEPFGSPTTTDGDGVASVNYTGVGVGNVKFQAKAKGELVVQDSSDLFNANSWFNRASDGVTVYVDNSSGSSQLQTFFKNRIPLGNGKVIELGLTECAYCKMQVAKYKTETTTYYRSWTITEIGNVKIFVLPSKVEIYLNGERLDSHSNSNDEEFNFFFQVVTGSIADFKYKDLVVYGLSDELLSDVRDVTDCKWLDKGYGTGNSSWNDSSTMTMDRTSGEYCKITPTFGSTSAVTMTISSDTTHFEFDMKLETENDEVPSSVIGFRQGNSNAGTFFQSNIHLDADRWYHIKIILNNGRYYMYLDGSTSSHFDIQQNMEHNRFLFRCDNDKHTTIYFKNFMAW